MLKFYFIFLPFCLSIAPLSKTKFDLSVHGKLKCAQYPAAAVKVRLWRDNEEHLLDETFVDKAGGFKLSASVIQRDSQPILAIYHDCDDGVKPGQRKLKFLIPRHYITFGNSEKRDFDLGTFNLETVMKYNEERVDDSEMTKKVRKIRTIHKSPRSDNLKKMEEDQKTNQSNKHHSRLRRYNCKNCDLKETTKTPFNGRDVEPDDRVDPW